MALVMGCGHGRHSIVRHAQGLCSHGSRERRLIIDANHSVKGMGNSKRCNGADSRLRLQKIECECAAWGQRLQCLGLIRAHHHRHLQPSRRGNER